MTTIPRRPRFALAVGTLVALAASGATPASRADAAGATSLYVYDLANASASVPNDAAANASVPLRLQGNWATGSAGTTFTGNTSGKRSVGVADPSTGRTIDVPATSAVGAATVFTFDPPSGGACPKDSKNLTQVGRFASGEAQLKLQLSACSGGAVKPQCRVAGGATPAGTKPVTGSGTITPGGRYRLECIKSPDSGSSASLTIRLTDVATGTTTAKTATIPDTGKIASSRPMSVANKYPLPTASANTDQFNGVVRRVAICRGDSVGAVRTCLGTAAPA